MSFCMMTSRVLMTYSVQRYFHSSSVYNRNQNYLLREGKFMNKMIKSEVKKKTWHINRNNKSFQPFTPKVTKQVAPHVSRRVIVLNKVFMHYITDLMATGEVSSELIGRGVEVSGVKVSNDFALVRVFWFSSEEDPAERRETENRLNRCALRLRHELSQLRVIGVVPAILFVKNQKQDQSCHIDKIMMEADYGDDYTPTIKIEPPKSELTLFSKLPENVREKIREISAVEDESNVEEEEDDEKYNVVLPPMKHDVLGLDHSLIMMRLKQTLSKVRAMKDKINDPSPVEIQRDFDPSLLLPYRTDEEAQAFTDFLLKRQIDEKRKDEWSMSAMDNFGYENISKDDEFEEDNEEPDIDGFEDMDPKDLR